jgi:PAS domain S-box-containing protein
VQASSKLKLRNVLALLLAILAGGGGLVWRAVTRADREVRDELLRQTHMLARTLKIEELRALARAPGDSQKLEYVRLKEQFAAVRATIPQCRSIYLIGRPLPPSAAARTDSPPPNGEICFFVDVGSDHEARPGQVYAAASAELRRAFETGMPFVEGPLPDASGRWISGRAPLADPRTNATLAVLSMNMDARDWKQSLQRAALPPALLTLALAALQMLGVALLVRCSRGTGRLRRWTRHFQLALVITASLLLTGNVTWMVYRSEVRHNDEDFAQLVTLRTRVVSSALRSVHNLELESLARLYQSRGESTPTEFEKFGYHLSKNPSVYAWALVPAVPAADKAKFEAQARAAGAEDFVIWQKDAQGLRVPASGRDVYYPVWQVAPMVSNGPVVGFDLGSDPLCRATLTAAARDGLTTVSEPVTWVQGSLDQKSLVIFQPVLTAGKSPRLNGFAVAVMSLQSLLNNVPSDDSALLEISLLRKDAPPEILAKQWDSANRPGTQISFHRPALAFGKAFTVTALAGPGFLRQRSLHDVWWSALMGLVLTTAFAVSLGLQFKRRNGLERLVVERTREIQDSEARFRQLAEATFEGVAIVDNGILLDGNQRFAEIHGYELTEMTGRPVIEFVAPQSRLLVLKGALKFHLRRHLVYNLRKDGSIFPTETHVRTGPWLGRTLRIITVRDQSETHAAEVTLQALRAELAHAQHLALISEVSAGIIHQLSQPLSAIGANLAVLPKLKAAEALPCDVMEIINDVESDVVRMRNIVNHLRALANPSRAVLACHDLNALVAKVRPILQAKADHAQIRLELDLHKSLPAIHADAIQISQVIVNLTLNAIQSAAEVPPERREVLITTRAHDECGVELSVRDYGTGLTPEALERLFTPFFTTKSSGMGVGLRLCQTIVHAHQGHIEGSNNTDGPGATFRIKLPLHAPVQ